MGNKAHSCHTEDHAEVLAECTLLGGGGVDAMMGLQSDDCTFTRSDDEQVEHVSATICLVAVDHTVQRSDLSG